MSLAKSVLGKRTVIWVLTWLTAIVGIGAYFDLSRLEDPEFTIKEAAVVTIYPGASPSEVEQEVTDRLERAILNMGQVERVSSRSEPGLSILRIRIRDRYTKVDLPQIWDELRRKVHDTQLELPFGTVPSIVYDDFGDVWSVFLTLSAPDGDYDYADLRAIAEDMERDLSTAKDVAKVEFVGIQEEAIFISFDTARLSALGLSEFIVARELASQNSVVNAGRVNTGTRSLLIHPSGASNSVEDIASTRIPMPRTVGDTLSDPSKFEDVNLSRVPMPGSDVTIALSDIATIERGYVDPAQSYLRINGIPAIGITVSTLPGGDVVKMGQSIQARLDEIEPALPAGVKLDVVAFQPVMIVEAVNGFMLNLAEASVIVIVVLLMFMGLRSGLIIGGVMVLTIIGTFLIMLIFEIPLQRVSLGALIIALGMLVDNAIVVLDGIQVRIARGRDRLEAAYEVIGQTALPLLGATIVAVMAFAAIATAQDDTGEFTQSLLQVVLISLLFSWVTAMIVTPLLAIKFMPKPSGDTNPPEGKAIGAYRSLLERCMRWRWVTIGVMIVVFASALGMLTQVEEEFFPSSTSPRMLVHMWAERGTVISSTDELAAAVQKDLSALPGVEQVLTVVGQGAPRYTLTYSPEDPDSGYAFFLVKVDNFHRIAGHISSIEKDMSLRHPQVALSAGKLSFGPGEGGKIQIRISGPQASELRQLADQVRTAMEGSGSLKAVRNDWREPVQVVVPQIASEEAKRLGISRQAIGATIRASFQGRVLGIYREGRRSLPIILRGQEPDRQQLDSISSTSVWSTVALNRVPLRSVVDGYEIQTQDDILRHRNRVPTLTIHGDPIAGLTPDAAFDVLRPALDEIELPPGYRWELGGEIEDAEKAQAALAPGILLFLVLMVLVVIILFNDLRQPAVIWLTVPLAIIGVVLGLLLSGQPFGFVSLLGLLALTGMLIKNAIVLIDEADSLSAAGSDRWNAVIDAGASRIRPVVLAATTTVLGMIPLLFDAFFIGLAVTVIGGLIVATGLTLVVVPVLYVIFFRAKQPGEVK